MTFRDCAVRAAPTVWPLLLVFLLAGPARAEQRTEHFDRDPHWEGINNRPSPSDARTVRQDFGYAASNHLGGAPGEVGGFISPAAEPAFDARRFAPRTFNDSLDASGRLICRGRRFNALLGYFNSRTVNEWRTANSVALRLAGKGRRLFVYVEYATACWRAGADTPGGFPTQPNPANGKLQLVGFDQERVYTWSLSYRPAADGGGAIRATVGDATSFCRVSAQHRADGATFDRFGLLNVVKSAAAGGEVWVDHLAINGKPEPLDRDPGWEGRGNRRTYSTLDVRPHADFGFSPTHYAGGLSPGELGGLIFRGDCRKPASMACYGDRLAKLSMSRPLAVSGTVCLRRGVTDSTVLIGFYSATESMRPNDSQSAALPDSFLGAAVEGPSREGFLFYPACRPHGAPQRAAKGVRLPHILPDGAPHRWSLRYQPGPDGGTIHLIFDGQAVDLAVPTGPVAAATTFNRFGIVTTWIDGNGQRVYFDDLTYTCRQD